MRWTISVATNNTSLFKLLSMAGNASLTLHLAFQAVCMMRESYEIVQYLILQSMIRFWRVLQYKLGVMISNPIWLETAHRVAVECAYGMLKNRWRIQGKRLDSKISFANKNAVACAVLHNFCLLNQDEWSDDENDDPRSKDMKATTMKLWGMGTMFEVC